MGGLGKIAESRGLVLPRKWKGKGRGIKRAVLAQVLSSLGAGGTRLNAQVGYAGRIDVKRTQLGVGELGLSPGDSLLVVDPIRGNVADWLVTGG